MLQRLFHSIFGPEPDFSSAQAELDEAHETIGAVRNLREHFRHHELINTVLAGERSASLNAELGKGVWVEIADGWRCLQSPEVPGFEADDFNFFIDYAQPGFRLELHNHMQREIIFLLKGKMACEIQSRQGGPVDKFEISGERQDARESLVFIEPYVFHGFTPLEPSILVVSFRPKLLIKLEE